MTSESNLFEVKIEAESEDEAGISYRDRVIKEEMVTRPVLLQPAVYNYSTNSSEARIMNPGEAGPSSFMQVLYGEDDEESGDEGLEVSDLGAGDSLEFRELGQDDEQMDEEEEDSIFMDAFVEADAEDHAAGRLEEEEAEEERPGRVVRQAIQRIVGIFGEDGEPFYRNVTVDAQQVADPAPPASSPRLSSGAVSPLTPPRGSPRSFGWDVSPAPGASRHRSRSPLNRAVSPNAEEPRVSIGERGRGRGGRRRSGARARCGWDRAHGGGRAGRNRHIWQLGSPISEMFVTDDEVPEDLRRKILEVYARREAQQRMVNRRREARAEEEEFFDAEDGGDAALFLGEEDATHFEWRPMEGYQPQKEAFLPQQTGPTTVTRSAYEAFSQYWDESILTYIVTETNRYAVGLGFADWYDTNLHEIFVLFAFWIMLGIIKMPSTKSCFSEHPLLTTSCFRMMFSRQRYERLCSALNFNDNSLRTPESSNLFPIEPITAHLNKKFKAAYIPRQEICIDESLTLWKGNLPFRQYIKTKAAKYGIKSFELCESATGYLWSFFIYTGRTSNTDPSLPSSLLKSTATVLSLVRPLLNKGYTLFMDNWFNSPLLARFLKRNKTDVVGTLRENRQHVPPLVTHCNLQPGQFAARNSGDMMVMAYHDNKKVTLISTCHGTESGQPVERAFQQAPWKPQLVLDYNKSMGGVDLKDGMLEAHLLERKKCLKWNMKLFKRLLNCSVLNSRICLEASINNRYKHVIFRLELVEQILNQHLNSVPRPRRQGPRPAPPLPVMRMTDNRHWPAKMRQDNKTVSKRLRCRKCHKPSVWQCIECHAALCIETCFGPYHNNPLDS